MRRLYAEIPSALHDTLLPAVFQILRPVLYTHAEADSGLLPFYRAVGNEPGISAPHKAQAVLQLADFWAHIGHDADSTGHYLAVVRPYWAAITDTQQASWYATRAQQALLQNQLQEATNLFHVAIERFEGLRDTNRLLGNKGNLANLYRSMGDYYEAIALRRQIADIFRRRKDSARLLITLEGLGADYTDLHRSDSARYFLDATQALLDAGIQNTSVAFYAWITRGTLDLNEGKYDAARHYFDNAARLLPKSEDAGAVLFWKISSLASYARVRNVRADAAAIQAAADTFVAEGNLELASRCYFSLWNAALVQPLQHTALEYHLAYDSLTAIRADTANRRYAARMSARYNAAQKNLTIALQQRKLHQHDIIIGLLVASLIGTGLLLSIGILRFRLLRTRRDAKRHQDFTRELLHQTEAERSRLAGHIHDGLSHSLLYLKRSLHEGPAAAAQKIDGLLNEVRAISRDLHPVTLRQIGLAHSIQNLCETTMAGSDLFVSADIDYPKPLSPSCELHLYRIVQESLHNILRHAQAIAAKVTLTVCDETLILLIQDNGRGFDVKKALAGGAAFGLLSILARGEALKGHTTIQSGATGTTIRLEIHLRHEHAAAG